MVPPPPPGQASGPWLVFVKGSQAALHRGKWGAWLIRPNTGLAGNDLANGFEIVIICPCAGSTGREEQIGGVTKEEKQMKKVAGG